MSKKKYVLNTNQVDINKLSFFYGIPHSHTNLSSNEASPMDYLEMAYKNDLDFIILTEHNNQLSKSFNSKNSNWQHLIKLIHKFNKRSNNFLAIPGFEVNSTSFGHFNIINPKNYFIGDVDNITALVIWTLKDSHTLISLNHPTKSIENLEYNSFFNSCITSIELANGTYNKKYNKYDKIYYNLLDSGWKLSAINGQDDNKINIGKEENLTCVICNALTRDNIIYALRNHHSFSTESKSLKLYFTINSSFMGSTISCNPNDELKFFINAEDSHRKISKIHIISNTKKLVKEIANIDLHNVKFIYQQKANEDETWYVIKVILSDKREAISSPIFINFDSA